jgi:hypothetical protein
VFNRIVGQNCGLEMSIRIEYLFKILVLKLVTAEWVMLHQFPALAVENHEHAWRSVFKTCIFRLTMFLRF